MTDHGIRTLLDLHGQIIAQENGCWLKFEARQVPASPGLPHGISYSLTLHAPDGSRLMGYDNAHPVKAGKSRFSGRRLVFDHRHRHAEDKGTPYQFQSASQLLTDFFNEVDRVLQEIRQS